MAISFKKYVDITSSVGGGAGIKTRDLILRLFTSSPSVPEKTVVEMTSADDVSSYFGSGSNEHKRAQFYFGFVSKNTSTPKRISFSRWAEVASAPRVYGKSGAYATAAFNGIIGGSFRLTLGATTANLTGLNFGTATTLSDVASVIQAEIRALTAGGANWTAATVIYNSVARRFEITGGAAGAAPIAISDAPTGTAIAALIGWDASAIYSPGVAAQEPLEAFTNSVQVSDNFGSFAFQGAVSLSQALAVATQNDTYNIKFIYSVSMSSMASASTYYATFQNFSGVAVTYSPLSNEYPELLLCSVLAATNYTKRNSVQNYMYQLGSLTPSVTTTADSDTLDNNRVNYYGRTQTAGQNIDFYQRGVMMGLATDPVDINTYSNEMWFKDSIGAQIMSLLLSVGRVPANNAGRGQLLSVIQSVIEAAGFNGTISTGKPFNTVQKVYITSLTGEENAWQQVQTIGYWIDIVMQSYVTTTGLTEWKAVYSLIYSKDDAIRKVEGSHTLI